MCGRLVLIGCSAAKAQIAAPPAELYTGGYHRLCRQAARRLAPPERIGILSARHGLVRLGDPQPLEPYDLRLGQPGSVTAAQVRAQAAVHDLLDADEVIVLAGATYLRLARRVWPQATAPLGGVGIGVQQQRLRRFLDQHHGPR